MKLEKAFRECYGVSNETHEAHIFLDKESFDKYLDYGYVVRKRVEFKWFDLYDIVDGFVKQNKHHGIDGINIYRNGDCVDRKFADIGKKLNNILKRIGE